MATAQLLVPNLTSTPVPSEASGLIALLEEEDDQLKVYALQRLHAGAADAAWAECASALPLLEALAEDPSFPAREAAAAVASKCFYHLEEYDDALRLALAAGPLFDLEHRSEYVQTLVAAAVDKYTAARRAAAAAAAAAGGAAGGGAPAEEDADPRLAAIVERMFAKCFADGAWAQAVGVALEALRLDQVEAALARCPAPAALCAYAARAARELGAPRAARAAVLGLVVAAQRRLPRGGDAVLVCQCLQLLGRAAEVARALRDLARGDEDQALLAYQVALDLVESEDQKFLLEVVAAFPEVQEPEAAPAAEAAAAGEEKKEGAGEEEAEPLLGGEATGPLDGDSEEVRGRFANLKRVLVDGFCTDLTLNFLHGQNNTDLLLLEKTKAATEGRNSVLHNATVVCHSLLQAGTTVDSFLRDNLDWMGRASSWAKFAATASLGAIHRGHCREAMNLLQPYLPQGGGATGAGYSEGGALYALGLIHANKNVGRSRAEAVAYLRGALRNAGGAEAVLHGACLGLGLAAMGSGDPEACEQLKEVLFQDNCVAGEAAALALGLVLLGAGAAAGDRLTELAAYAHDTQHEKIVRALALCQALVWYGCEEGADAAIEQLARDRDPLLRYGAMFAVGLAYCGTGANAAVRRLLHVAVSDVADDVRRAAVACLGFVLCRTPERVPPLVALLAESFNPHVRYGACLAIGIACAGTAQAAALAVVQPMLKDPQDFVRQGALLAQAMVLMQAAESRTPAVRALREKLASLVADKHQSTLTKMGAVLATGLLDAGGRNVTIALQSRAGFLKPSAAVGLAIWLQHWYWYPLMHFLPLAFTPTHAIGLTKDFKMPQSFQVKCAAKPSHFAYPKKMEEKKEEKKEKIATVQLSTTAKAKAREARKKAEEEGTTGGGNMDVDSAKEEKEDAKMEDAEDGKEETKGEEKEGEKKKKEPEPTSFMVKNSSRVTPVQEALMTFDLEQRYVPVREGCRAAGVFLLRDRRPGEPAAEGDLAEVAAPALAGEEDEAEAPEPFEWGPSPEDEVAD